MELVSFGTTDLVIFVGALLLTVMIGLHFSKGNNSMNAYMKADGQLSVFPVAVSLMSSCFSGLTMIGSGAEIFYQGPNFSFIWVSVLISGPLASFTILPIFFRMKELSLHTYLERRFGPWMRNFISVIYIAKTIFYCAIVMYLPAMALESMLGMSKLHSIMATGALCLVYSVLGGIRAVIWTDTFLGLIMIIALSVAVVVGTIDAGGVARVFEIGAHGQRLDTSGLLDMSLTARHTLLGLSVGATMKQTYLIFVNQVQMQRVLSLNSLRQAQLAFILCSIFAALMCLLSTYIGLLVYAAYRDCDPFLGGQIRRRDALVLHYMSLRLSRMPGVLGIFSAGLVSGALSAVSSFANSMAALLIEDFLLPIRASLNLEPLGSKSSVWLAKVFSAVAGILCILAACLVDRSSPRLLQTVHLLGAAVGVPLLAAFAAGIFMRFANAKGLATALVVTISLGIHVTISQTFKSEPLEPAMPVYYNQQCAQIFNRSTSLQEANEIADQLPVSEWKPKPEYPPVRLENLSYLIIPILTFVSVIIITTIVSFLTGGDTPDKELLVGGLDRKQKFNINPESGQTKRGSDSIDGIGVHYPDRMVD